MLFYLSSILDDPNNIRNQWINTGTDGKHPNKFDGEQMGNDDWIGKREVKRIEESLIILNILKKNGFTFTPR